MMGQPRTRIINTPKGRTIIQLRSVEDLSFVSSDQSNTSLQDGNVNDDKNIDENLIQSRKRFYSMDGLALRGKCKLSAVKENELLTVNENCTSNFYTDLHVNKESQRRRSSSVCLHLGSKSLSNFISPSKFDKSLNGFNELKSKALARSTPSIPELNFNKLKNPTPYFNEDSDERSEPVKKIPPKKPPRTRTRALSMDNIMGTEVRNKRRQSIAGTPHKRQEITSPNRPRLATISSLGELPSTSEHVHKRRPVVRAPSRLYKVLDTSNERKKNLTSPQILGPEFVVRSKEAAKMLMLSSKQGNPKGIGKKVTVVLITGQRIEMKCDPLSVKVKHVLEAIMDEEQLPLPHLFGLSILIGGEFHFLSPNTKLHKVAPSGWKDTQPNKHGLFQDNFTLHLRLIYYLRFGDLVRLEAKMRRLIYLQLRHDLLEGRLPLPLSTIIQLTALTLQAEFGDYAAQEPGYFMLEHYVPEMVLCSYQTNQLTEELYKRHSAFNGLLPFQAQARFVALLQDMLYYGAHFFKTVLEKSGSNQWIGIWPGGLLVLTGPPGPDNLCRASLHPWPVVKRVSYSSTKLNLTVKSPGGVLKLKYLMTSNRSNYVCYLCKVHQNFYRDQSAVLPQGLSQLSCGRELSQYDVHPELNDKTLQNSKNGKRCSRSISTRSTEYYSLSTSSDTLRSQTTTNSNNLSPCSSKDNVADEANKETSMSSVENGDLNLSSMSSAESKECPQHLFNGDSDYITRESKRKIHEKISEAVLISEDRKNSLLNFIDKLSISDRKTNSENGYSSDDKRSSRDNSIDSLDNLSETETGKIKKEEKKHSQMKQNFLQNIFWHGNSGGKNEPFTNKFKEKLEDEVDGEEEKSYIELPYHHQRSFSNVENVTEDSIVSDVSRGYDSDETLLRSPKKGCFSVKMGTRVSAAALHKQRLRSLETVQPLPSLEELNTSAVIMEPSVRSIHLEESIDESLVERFLKSGSSTNSFKCCERRLSSVTLTKDVSGSLGVTIGEGVDHGLYIQSVAAGGPAHIDGQLKAGDRIVGINGLSVESFSYSRAVEMLRSAPPQVTLLVSQPILLSAEEIMSPSSFLDQYSSIDRRSSYSTNSRASSFGHNRSANQYSIKTSDSNTFPQTLTPDFESQKGLRSQLTKSELANNNSSPRLEDKDYLHLFPKSSTPNTNNDLFKNCKESRPRSLNYPLSSPSSDFMWDSESQKRHNEDFFQLNDMPSYSPKRETLLSSEWHNIRPKSANFNSKEEEEAKRNSLSSNKFGSFPGNDSKLSSISSDGNKQQSNSKRNSSLSDSKRNSSLSDSKRNSSLSDSKRSSSLSDSKRSSSLSDSKKDSISSIDYISDPVKPIIFNSTEFIQHPEDSSTKYDRDTTSHDKLKDIRSGKVTLVTLNTTLKNNT